MECGCSEAFGDAVINGDWWTLEWLHLSVTVFNRFNPHSARLQDADIQAPILRFGLYELKQSYRIKSNI